MVRHIFSICGMTALALCVLTECNNPASESTDQGDTPRSPSGVTVIYSEGFGGDLSKWETNYMITVGDFYPRMRISSDASHTGKYSITADSNRTALLYKIEPRIETGVVGVQFYIMAKEEGDINFTVEMGKNAGSSGGLGKAFGIGFDPNDSIKCKVFDMLGDTTVADSMIGPIERNHWYKCVVEIDFEAKTVVYYIDDVRVRKYPLPVSDMGFIDRLLVFRGMGVERPGYLIINCQEGAKQYFADDIVLYTK